MIRFLWQLLVVLAPIGAFAWWALGPVQTHLYHGSASVGILLLLAGLGAYGVPVIVAGYVLISTVRWLAARN